jgi:8-oxo-dGTP pyrophosphatase MutT (NUDIX family)
VVPIFTVRKPNTIFIPLGRRSQNLNLCPGDWGLVAGFLDWNESAKECVLREVWEELGIDLSLYTDVPDQPNCVNSFPEKSENETISLQFIVKCDVDELPELKPQCDEVTDTFWHNVFTDLPPGMKLAFNHKDLMKWAYVKTSTAHWEGESLVLKPGGFPRGLDTPEMMEFSVRVE